MKPRTLFPGLLDKMDVYWRAANYLAAGRGVRPMQSSLCKPVSDPALIIQESVRIELVEM